MTDRQVAMVIDLNKCIGCQACTAACKSLWTDEPGQEYMLWNNVETKPGPGYPRYWEDGGGGWNESGTGLKPGVLPAKEDHGEEIPLNFDAVYFEGTEKRLQQERSMGGKGANWDEDTSSGDYPNNYHFYLPRLCNHCTKPACLEACPVRAIYKREEDGIVLVDQDKCQGFRECNKACPYDKVYFNYVQGKSQKCIFCFPRLEEGVAPACARQCPGRLRFVGFLEDDNGPIDKLVNQWKVALPLHPEYGTEPNVYYVPPILPPKFDEAGNFVDDDDPRVPMEYLRSLFGPAVDQALITLHEEMERKQAGKESELMDLLIAKEWKSLFNIPDVRVA
jgi:nitrate reductase beta subunit